MVAVYHRTNLTMRQLAPLFGVSPTTVCRVIQRLRPFLALEPAPRPVYAADLLWIVDGRARNLTTVTQSLKISRNRPATHPAS
jgi:hypothetical protein